MCRESYQDQRSTKVNNMYKGEKFILQCYGRSRCIRGKPVIRERDGPHGRTIWYTQDQLLIPRVQRKDLITTTKSIDFMDENENMDEDRTEIQQKSDGEHLKPFQPYDSISKFLVDDSWRKILHPFLMTNEFRKIDNFVQSEKRFHTIYPPVEDIFSALNKCPFDKVKVVIIGQDPYHGQGQGHGLAFSVRKGNAIPPSLLNIFKELASDQKIALPKHGELSSWANQGVLLLNSVLTVRAGVANSHAGHGWEIFTDEVVRLLNVHKNGLVFLLWGNQAAIKASAVDSQRHTVIITSHPSPLGHTKTKSPFTVSGRIEFILIFHSLVLFLKLLWLGS